VSRPVALLVEDNALNRELARALLSAGGFDVVEVGSGAAALEAIDRALPDVVLLDIGLPDLTGEEVVARIRADERTRGLPVIAVTAYAMRGDEERLLATGFDGYVSKPIRSREFVSAVRAVMQAKSA
jgi:CheY-like chemotaxis protein